MWEKLKPLLINWHSIILLEVKVAYLCQQRYCIKLEYMDKPCRGKTLMHF